MQTGGSQFFIMPKNLQIQKALRKKGFANATIVEKIQAPGGGEVTITFRCKGQTYERKWSSLL